MLFSSDNKDVWDYVQQVNEFRKFKKVFVELEEFRSVAVHAKHVVYYL